MPAFELYCIQVFI